MKKLTFILLITLIFVNSGSIKAQSDTIINNFIAGVDNYVKELSRNPNNIHYSKGFNNRHVRISGRFDNREKTFKQKIRYYKGGFKKEKIIIKWRGPKKPYLLLKIVRINDQYFYIQKYTYATDTCVYKNIDERLIDGRIYRKVEYDNKRKITKQVESWIMK